MFHRCPGSCWRHCTLWALVVWLTVGSGTAGARQAQLLPPSTWEAAAPTLSREAVVRWALENSPELAAIRQQRGIAAAAVVIAQTYPFNPVLESRIEGASGPASAGITNAVLNEHKVLLEVELRGQGDIRRQVAATALTRTEWEIASQEVQLVSRVLRAFDGVLYRQAKRRLSLERLRLNEIAAKQIRALREQGKLGAADLILILSEVDDARAQGGAGELALNTAENDLARATGSVQLWSGLSGSLGARLPPMDLEALTALALERRPDVRARQVAVTEAEARLRLENSNRFGNPTFGPSYGYDPTRISSIGVTLLVPLPVFNAKRGEIQQRQAELTRAVLDLRQTEVQARLEIQSALARAQRAERLAEMYEKQVLPNLEKSLQAVENLFINEAGVDVLRVLEVRRNLLRSQDAYLDALWESAQAKADLVAAVGDLGLIFGRDGVPCLSAPR